MKLVVLPLLLMLIFGATAGEKAPGHRAKRSDDPNQLETVVMQLSEELSELKAQVVANSNSVNAQIATLRTQQDNNNARVSFLAQIASDRGTTFAGNGPYKFDQVLLNDGDAYDPMLGVFTAPYSGVYVFAAQVFTDRAERPLVDIRVNDKPLARMAINSKNLHDGEDEDSISTTVTVQLEDQDRVWLQSSVGDSFTYWGDHHTFFTGFLLYKAA
ncbi:hypothetical protein BaRGS_00003047 [Batillaria attramentaria]|uniref:C1q domain-containing protein n=1 Tax=Batillaria attramentaria TaxID=370345 RepID=A0ABD0M2Q0_9CAEN